MLRKPLRLAAYAIGATLLLTAAAVPANASSTEGMTKTTYDQCTTDAQTGVTFCRTGNQRRIEVHTPSGVVILQGSGEFSESTTFPGGTSESVGTNRYVSVFGSSVETPDGPFYIDPKVIRIDSESTSTYSGGLTCDFDMNWVIANGDGGYDHSTVVCSSL